MPLVRYRTTTHLDGRPPGSIVRADPVQDAHWLAPLLAGQFIVPLDPAPSLGPFPAAVAVPGDAETDPAGEQSPDPVGDDTAAYSASED